MNDRQLYLTYVGGPTLLLEWRGLRLLTDPTFDPAGSEYPTASYTLSKTQGPAVSPERLERVDAVLLSHDHHFDNLDAGGRAFLESAGAVLTTTTGATRLGGASPWTRPRGRRGDPRHRRLRPPRDRHAGTAWTGTRRSRAGDRVCPGVG